MPIGSNVDGIIEVNLEKDLILDWVNLYIGSGGMNGCFTPFWSGQNSFSQKDRSFFMTHLAANLRNTSPATIGLTPTSGFIKAVRLPL